MVKYAVRYKQLKKFKVSFMVKKKSENFEELFSDIQNSVESLEQSKLSIDGSMKVYEETMKKIEKARNIIENMETRIVEISSK